MVASCQSDQYGCPAPHRCYGAAAPASDDSGSVWCVSESAGLWRGARVGILRLSAVTFQHERGDADQSGPPRHHLWKPTWKVLHAGRWHSLEWTHTRRSQFTLAYENTCDEKNPKQQQRLRRMQLPPHVCTHQHTQTHHGHPAGGLIVLLGKKGLCK